MHRIPLLLLFTASLAAVLPAAAQTTPRRPPADTVRFGTTRPAAGDSIAMAEYEEEDEGAATSGEGAKSASGAEDEAAADTVPVKPRSGPYSRASGTGPFSVQASGETAARPPRGDVVWLQGRAARPAASDSARRDTARAGSGTRVASGGSARRDTASATGSRPARRDSASTASRPAARDTAGARRNGQAASTSGGRTGSAPAASATTGGRTGSTPGTTTTAGGRTGSAPGAATTAGGRTGPAATTGARARTHTVASGETFFAIARRYGVTAAQLRAINPDVEQDALEVGDVLRLPAAARDSRAGSSSSSSSSSAASGSRPAGSQAAPRTGSQGGSTQRRSHTVAAGETLFGIARRYGVTVDAIRQANELDGDGLRTGQRLVIPPAR